MPTKSANTKETNIKITRCFQSAFNDALHETEFFTGKNDVSYQKARIYCELAKALALTGQVDANAVSLDVLNETVAQAKPAAEVKAKEEPAPKQEQPAVVKPEPVVETVPDPKQALKRKPASSETVAPQQAEVKPEPVAEATPAPVQAQTELDPEEPQTSEWTEQAMQYYAKEFEYIAGVNNIKGPDYLNKAVKEFTGGIYDNLATGVNPLNIRGFVAFLHDTVDAKQAS